MNLEEENDEEYTFNDEEIEKISRLTDPEDSAKQEHYSWDDNFQRNIIGLLLNDRWFLVQCRDLVKFYYFTDEVHQQLCRIVFDYLDKYNNLSRKDFVIQEILDVVKNKDSEIQNYFINETNLIYAKFIPNLADREYLLEKITNFAKLMAIKSAFDVSLGIIKKDPENEDTWTKIQNILRDALLVDRNFEEGLDYFNTFDERYQRMKENEEAQEIFTSGFKEIDDALLGGGTHRGEIYSWIGLSGTGKSLALVTAAIRNILQLNKKVLYVSLEMDQDKIAERFDAQLSDVEIGKLQENQDLVKKAFKEFKENHEDARMLIIKQFPAGAMTVNTLKAYLQQLYMINFKPDLLIIDYIGEMKDHPNMPTYESRYRIVRDLRGLATEENLCIFTAMQPNKSARDAQKVNDFSDGVIDDSNLADSYGQIRPLDGCWSINQMQAEKEAGIARIFVIKHRHGRSRFSFHVQYNNKTLAMNEISANKYQTIYKQYQFEKDKLASELQAKEYKNKKEKNNSSFSNDIGYNNIDIDPDQPDFPGDKK